MVFRKVLVMIIPIVGSRAVECGECLVKRMVDIVVDGDTMVAC